MTVQEKIAFYSKLTKDRARWANEAVRNIKRKDTSNIKLGTTFHPGSQYSKTEDSSNSDLNKKDQETT